MVARRSSMTTCARCGRCFCLGHGPCSAPSIGRARSASSISGSRGPRCRSGTARPAAAGSSSRVWGFRAPVPARWCSPSRRRTCWPGSRAVCGRSARCRKVLVWDRQAGLHARDGRPTEEFAGFCGQLKVDWRFCEPADPQAKGGVERLQGFAETNFEPGRVFLNELDFQDQLDSWFDRVNARTHKALRERPVDRLARELELMAPLPAAPPDTDRRWVLRVPPDPHLRFDTNDYSLDPGLVG